jgi:predicted  nucleic acid-binding Zn-ribbon protein
VSQTAALHYLQTLDSQIDVVRRRLAEIDDQLSQDGPVRAAQAALAEAEESLNTWRARLGEVERDRDRLQQDAKTAEDRLYSGQVHNPRELTDLQDKIAELGHRRETLEDPILEAMLAIDEGGQVIVSRQAELDRLLNEQARAFGDLGRERATLNSQLQDLDGKAAEARTQVEATHLASYDRLRHKSGGVAVTQIQGNGCGVCGVELTTQLIQRVRHDEIIPCPTCGRILHI